tara:strand:+ start:3774 stop:4205 length:432 start_codon:yes stop_codon:yes gene_type:complete
MQKLNTMLMTILTVAFPWDSQATEASQANNSHPAVTAAIHYVLPADDCTKPKLRSFNFAVDLDAQVAEKKAWIECDQAYSAELLKNFNTLKASAQHGLTTDQAKAILQNMALIQNALIEQQKARKRYNRVHERKLNHITLQPE